MADDISKIFTAAEFAVLALPIAYILIVKRDPLDPRLYVLYGIFHWLFVGQFYYVFNINSYFDFYIYEPTTFNDIEILTGSVLVLLSTCSFVLGYSLPSWHVSRTITSRHCSITILDRLRAGYRRSLVYVSCSIFAFAALSSYLFESGSLTLPITLILPIGYLMPVSSIFIAIIIFLHKYKSIKIPIKWRIAFISMLCWIVLASNIALIYPLITIFVLFASKILPSMKRTKIVFTIIVAPIFIFSAMTVQLAGKTYRRLQMAGVEIDLNNFFHIDAFNDSLKRSLVTLDSFNTDSFAVTLQALRDYTDQGNYLYGATILSSVPIFKLLNGEIFQSFGRALAIKSLGVSLDSNTALAVSPIAEMSVNFSYIGSLLFYFLLGAICFIAYNKFKRSKSFASVPVYIVFLVWLFLQQRGDFLNGNMYSAYVLIVTYLIAQIIQKNHAKLWSCGTCFRENDP